MQKETKETNRNRRLSYLELREKNAYIHYVVCRKMTWKYNITKYNHYGRT